MLLEELQAALDTLNAQRAQIAAEGPFLQHCWLVQVKPGGTARTGCKYWQVRSRQPLFDGKMLKHLKTDEVEDYKAAIARGKQIKQIDQQIKKLQQQINSLTVTHAPTDAPEHLPALVALEEAPLRASTLPEAPQQVPVSFTDLTEQDRYVSEVLATSQALRASLQTTIASCRKSEKRSKMLAHYFPPRPKAES